jgi:hypothetical protein
MEGLGAILALKQLDEDDVGMAFGPTFDRVLSHVAQTLVELRGLKAVRREYHLRAASTKGLRLSCVEEHCSQPVTSMTRVDPEIRDLAATSPGVAIEACDDFACCISNVSSQEPSVKVPCRFGVELVNAINKERLQLLALNFIEQHNSVTLHGT